jgi:endonuclease-3
MQTTINKQRAVNLLLARAPKSSNGEAPQGVLEQFVFALCRENATAEQADRAFRALRERFFDWNEVRVSSTREVEEALEGLSDTEPRAQRLIAFLQEVFEAEFKFDLEGLHKKGLKIAAKQLLRYQAADEYVGSWVVQRSLGGHAIPLDGPTLRCARRITLIDSDQEDQEAARASLEHLVPKAKGAQFSDAISEIADQFCWETEPNCPACPLRKECATGQEVISQSLTAVRSSRAKPR